MMVGRIAVALAAAVFGFGLSGTVDGAVSFASVVPGGERIMPTCKAVAVNYITHGLPQQCLRISRTSTVVSLASEIVEPSLIPVTAVSHRGLNFGRPPNVSAEKPPTTTAATTTATTTEASPAPLSSSTSNAEFTAPTDPPKEDDSPLDTANFLSFEEWRAQNLAKAGQSSDTFEPRTREPRRDPRANTNALDALGEDSEIELDFGFDSGNGGAPEYRVSRSDKVATPSPAEPGSRLRSKDAGKTCRERFNYASFDCAATVHKTNPGCKGPTSILLENKDSYMRNKCSQENKHFIVELCEDILVDTVVLANFEFFSSMFRTFRVSVSDRYPAKASGWKDLGTFQARNSRQVQAFLIENPLIWARYLKVELLTHYGNEFYCPVSLLRVHGTTMMEEFRYQEELARGEIEDDVSEELAPEAVAEIEVDVHMATPASTQEERPTESYPEYTAAPVEAMKDEYESSHVEKRVPHEMVDPKPAVCKSRANNGGLIFEPARLPVCGVVYTPSTTIQAVRSSSQLATVISAGSISSTMAVSSQTTPSMSKPSSKDFISITPSAQSSSQQREATPAIPKPVSLSKPLDSYQQEPRQQQNSPSPSHPQPHPASPTTQESFFKTVHKRLSLLEQNATLSLQYIEDQSRILRDAFMKVEKRQMEKTTAFIEQLNSTFLTELKVYVRPPSSHPSLPHANLPQKDKYDQLWQSTVIALESQREQSERDMAAVSTRLTILADEMIFQKRMYQIQSFLLLITIGVVIFSRNSQLDKPLLQHMRSRSTNLRMIDTPPSSPLSMRRGGDVEGVQFELSSPPPEDYAARDEESPNSEGRMRGSLTTPNGTRTRRSWAQFGPRLKVEGKSKRWQRLPSPLGSAGDAGDEFEGEERLAGLGLDGVRSQESRSPEVGAISEASPVFEGIATPELSSEGSEES